MPTEGRLNFSKELFVDNPPINLGKIISFDTDYFRGLPINIVDNSNYVPACGLDGMDQNEIINSSVDKDGIGLGAGYPAITFRHNYHDMAMIQWVFETEKDRDTEYNRIVNLVTAKGIM